jgi:hypothetical protein
LLTRLGDWQEYGFKFRYKINNHSSSPRFEKSQTFFETIKTNDPYLKNQEGVEKCRLEIEPRLKASRFLDFVYVLGLPSLVPFVYPPGIILRSVFPSSKYYIATED